MNLKIRIKLLHNQSAGLRGISGSKKAHIGGG